MVYICMYEYVFMVSNKCQETSIIAAGVMLAFEACCSAKKEHPRKSVSVDHIRETGDSLSMGPTRKGALNC